MKKQYLLFFFFSFFLVTICSAQSDINLLQFNQDRLQKQQTGMLILGGWALVNIAGGLALASNSDGTQKYFHGMNAGWNVINLGIAGLGYYAAMKSDPASFDLYASIQEQHKFQKILLFNAGLDLGYIAGGFYLIERSKVKLEKADQFKGFGRAIILQGAFLFAFDLVNYAIHAKQNPQIQKLLSSIQFDGTQLGLVLQF